MILHDGSRRDTVYYSVLVEEWPDVKQRLLLKANGDKRSD
jgi:hypothetical protein